MNKFSTCGKALLRPGSVILPNFVGVQFRALKPLQAKTFVLTFLPTVPTFAVRETDVSRHNGGTSGAPLKPLRDDSALRPLSSLRGLSGVGMNGLKRTTKQKLKRKT